MAAPPGSGDALEHNVAGLAPLLRVPPRRQRRCPRSMHQARTTFGGRRYRAPLPPMAQGATARCGAPSPRPGHCVPRQLHFLANDFGSHRPTVAGRASDAKTACRIQPARPCRRHRRPGTAGRCSTRTLIRPPTAFRARAIPHRGGGQVERHDPRTAGPEAGPFVGIPLPAARPVAARHARPGISATAENHQRQRLFLAHARLRPLPNTVVKTQLLDCQAAAQRRQG